MTPQSRLDIMSLSADSIPCTPHPPGGDHRAWLPPRAHAKLITSLPHINSVEFTSLIQICACSYDFYRRLLYAQSHSGHQDLGSHSLVKAELVLEAKDSNI